MKHTFNFLVCTLLISGIASAQVDFGVRAGLNLSKWKFDQAGPGLIPSLKTGSEFGLYANIPVANKFSIRPEINLSSYGTRVKDNGEHLDYRSRYITVPVLAQYKFNSFSVLAGPQVGFLASGKTVYNGTKNDVKDYMAATVIYGVVGVNYDFGGGLSAGARFNLGLSSIEVGDENSIRETSFGISLGYDLSRFFARKKTKIVQQPATAPKKSGAPKTAVKSKTK